ncbi:MAG: hypothetical protein ACLSBH_08170 [Coprobacillus cateniformis]
MELLNFAQGLVQLGFEIVSTGGTLSKLQEAWNCSVLQLTMSLVFRNLRWSCENFTS